MIPSPSRALTRTADVVLPLADIRLIEPKFPPTIRHIFVSPNPLDPNLCPAETRVISLKSPQLVTELLATAG
jgi:hypothetical protein